MANCYLITHWKKQPRWALAPFAWKATLTFTKTVASTKGIHYYAEPRENPVPYFLLKELREGYLTDITGVYHTPEGYFVDEKEAEIFDAQFPAKERLKLPGQLV